MWRFRGNLQSGEQIGHILDEDPATGSSKIYTATAEINQAKMISKKSEHSKSSLLFRDGLDTKDVVDTSVHEPNCLIRARRFICVCDMLAGPSSLNPGARPALVPPIPPVPPVERHKGSRLARQAPPGQSTKPNSCVSKTLGEDTSNAGVK